ncbi:MAG: tRNA glutamyl-Q(34) synthetase GluQRS [Erythrobacter sp.]|nr:tRNA glutamyl-Q(34) synthetase GluQRS [Erythrobacter sp.]
MNAGPVTRFAPSPNGYLHLGHAYCAIVAHDLAAREGGRFLLRIEDIDGPRSRPEFADAIRRDLEWLGLEWHEVAPQSTRLELYAQAARELEQERFAYRCSCTRQEIAGLEHRIGSDGVEYPGSCKGLHRPEDFADAGQTALRLDLDALLAENRELVWQDRKAGTVIADPREFGDVVIVRKDLPASYHLAATLDDAADGVTLVTRGLDLFSSTHVHRWLQELLGLPVPDYWHHSLLLGEDGEKLAKSKGSPTLKDRRLSGEDGRGLADRLRAMQRELGT